MEPPTRPSPADPLDTLPPAFSPGEAADIAERIFGLTGSTSPLDSERDQNFRFTSDAQRSFLLKISNGADDPAVLEMQTQAMLHIAHQDPGLPVMQPLTTLEGGYHGEVEGAGGDKQLVRLFTFVPGRAVDTVELSPSARRGFGSMVARMGLALRGFFHPAGGYRILWDLKHTPQLRPLLEAVPGGRRYLVEQVLERFEERVRTVLPSLRAQLIHNDLTLDNVLLDDVQRVTGIVDFGDLTHTAVICDLAIALVSLTWHTSDPLEASRQVINGYTSISLIEEGEADVLADLVLARLAALVLIANWRVIRYPENAAYITANQEIAWRLLEHFDSLTWPKVQACMRAACLRAPESSDPGPRPSIEELLERRRRALGPALSPLSYQTPLHLLRGDGSHVFDHEGNAYLDAYNNVPVAGHCHPRVVAAIAEQSSALNTNTRYLHESVVELAERLVATMPPGLDTVMFFNSGSEANDIAWRLATAYTGRAGGIVTAHAYHGVTTATAALSPEEWGDSERAPYIATIPAPDGYRGPHRREEQGGAGRYATHFDEAVATLESRGFRPAALFADSLFTSDGIFAPPATYLQELVRRVRRAGCLFVADEVQCGFGRSGSHLWSFQAAGVAPDFVTLGKPMGNGHPVAAVVTRAEIAERFASHSDVFSTFGGNPVACRAALAVLDVLEQEGLQDRARVVGRHLRSSLETVMKRHRSIGDVRGAGLLIGVDLVHDRGTRRPAPRLAHAVTNRMKERGVLVGSTGPDGNVLKIRPPLVLTTHEADVISQTLDACLDELEAAAPGEGFESCPAGEP